MSPLIALALTASLSVPPAVSAPGSSSDEFARPTLAAQVAALTGELGARSPEVPATRAARMPPGGDSLKNGAITGAVVAGVALGGFLYYLCRALDDTGGDANCFGPSLVAGGIAAAGGAAVGAGIDALFVRAPSVRMRVRF